MDAGVEQSEVPEAGGNRLCGVNVGLGNKMESIEKNLTLPQSSSLATTRNYKLNGRGEEI